jgi:hypothetical protein|tara:strand:- start:102 stop:293 length:192 start_codon:yes stop_codon:yes gene_type:complete
MRTKRIMHGKRRKRSSCLKKTEEIKIAMPEPNYAPTEDTKFNPMDQASSGLSQNKMNIERDKQ